MRAGIVNVKGSSVSPQCEDKMPVSPSDTQEAVNASAFIPGYVWSPSLITCQVVQVAIYAIEKRYTVWNLNSSIMPSLPHFQAKEKLSSPKSAE